MKKTILSISLIIASILSFSQLKVNPLGNIGMGTNFPSSSYKCDIRGNLLLSNWPNVPFVEFQFMRANPGPQIGSTTDQIDFWSTWVGHNKLLAQGYWSISDKNLKTEVSQISEGLEKLMKLNCYEYKLKDNFYNSDSSKSSKSITNYGFFSQEIKDVFPNIDITIESQGVLLMNYDQIIPVAVKAIQEQQLEIEKLKEELQNLKENNQLYRTNRLDHEIISNKEKTTNANVLYQNAPNPFSESTEIKFKLNSDNFESGEILIFDMNGLLINSYQIKKEMSSIKINGNELNSGMYIYTLVINNQEIDTKRMILSK